MADYMDARARVKRLEAENAELRKRNGQLRRVAGLDPEDAHPTPEQTESEPQEEVDYWSRGHSMTKRAAEQTGDALAAAEESLRFLEDDGYRVSPRLVRHHHDIIRKSLTASGVPEGVAELQDIACAISEAAFGGELAWSRMGKDAFIAEIRRRLRTNSGVPYVPESIHLLPQHLRSLADEEEYEADQLHGMDEENSVRIGRAEAYRDAAGRIGVYLADTLASAPAAECVPYVPEEVRRLPGRMEADASEEAGRGNHEVAHEIQGWSDEVARALASAPAVHTDSVRPDYALRCEECGRAHILDTSLPSHIWNQIAKPEDILCTVCIDQRLVAQGMTAEAEFYFAGKGLQSKLYGHEGWKLVPVEPTGEMKREYERTMLRPFSSGADAAWRNMVKAAPTHGGSDESAR